MGSKLAVTAQQISSLLWKCNENICLVCRSWQKVDKICELRKGAREKWSQTRSWRITLPETSVLEAHPHHHHRGAQPLLSPALTHGSRSLENGSAPREGFPNLTSPMAGRSPCFPVLTQAHVPPIAPPSDHLRMADISSVNTRIRANT